MPGSQDLPAVGEVIGRRNGGGGPERGHVFLFSRKRDER